MHSIRGDKLSILNKRRRIQNHRCPELPDDILLLIFEKLGLVDRIRACTVCKNWFRQKCEIPNQGEFPLLFQRNIIDCKVNKLTDEYSKKSYLIVGQHLDGAQICDSKFGWILMRRNNNNILNNYFVYCPFNSKLMNLPSLNTTADHTLRYYTYSSNPTLSDCVFFAILIHNCQLIDICTCRIGDEEWQKFQINLSIPYVRFSFECINGLLYVVLLRKNDHDVDSDPILNSHVGTFDPQSQEWKLIKNEKGFMKKSSNGKEVDTRNIKSWNLFPVVYNNKELYLFRESMSRFGDIEWDVFKYDMEENQWVEEPSLGNRVLFIGYDCGSSLLVDAVGKLSNLANKAMLGIHGLPYCYCYSFSSRKVESNHKFYVDDDRNSKYRIMYYESAWIIV